jgi:acyl carrier protein
VSQYSTQVVEIVNNILHEKFEVPKASLVPTANLKEDLQLDSLDFVDMFILLEQETGKNPQNVDFMKIKNLGDIYQLVSELTAEETVN